MVNVSGNKGEQQVNTKETLVFAKVVDRQSRANIA